MSEREIELLDEVARLLAVLVRQTAKTQREAIMELSASGLKPTRIGELLGTSTGTVSKEISRSKSSERRGSADGG